MPLAAPLTMLVSLGAFIPIVGPIVAAALAALVALVALVTTGPWAALVVLLSIALGTLVDGVVGAALAVPPHGGGVVRGPVVAATARSDW
ncbi:hypothetical protein MHK71_10240 [Kocuria indica]|uniref:hypothetical protein n=1 Tax=Kocuria marina TaxID=223184 RepID=UPI0011A04048|nr:hypothetical protein [Kocuria indica]MCG7432862.1 hypothetical protein [Kocuria indica]